MAEPTEITGQILNEMREEMRRGFGSLHQAIANIKTDVQHIPAMRADINELQVSVAAIATSQGIMRQDIDGLKETVARIERTFDFESRIRRIETHLGLSQS